MSKLKFDSLADNAGFMSRMQEIRTEIDSADNATSVTVGVKTSAPGHLPQPQERSGSG